METENILNPKNAFTSCLTCDTVFLNDREKNMKGDRLCPRCGAVFLQIAERLKVKKGPDSASDMLKMTISEFFDLILESENRKLKNMIEIRKK